jgi:hypothetical protein
MRRLRNDAAGKRNNFWEKKENKEKNAAYVVSPQSA